MTTGGTRIVGAHPLPNMPWENKPAGCREPMWRYSGNPVIPRDTLPESSSVFNGSAVPFEDGFAGVFRVDDRHFRHRLHVGRSHDGIHWELEAEPIVLEPDSPDVPPSDGGYDPRLCLVDGRWMMTWANGFHGPSVGIAWTTDFRQFRLGENAFLPNNRNGVLFPRKVNGMYGILSRPCGEGQSTFGDIFFSESPDLCHWGRHRHVMGPVPGWDDTKIGAGPPPLETSEGWLLIYHGIKTTCNGYVYRVGGALLDLEEPWKVLYRSDSYLMGPEELYECVGDTPNVVFPCGMLVDSATGRLAIYYGAADTCMCLAFADVDGMIGYIKAHSY